MWPFASYPEHCPSEVDGKTYDYIVVGGGVSGCVVASLLSQDPHASVLVLDKGHAKDTLLSRMPLLSQSFQLADALQIQNTRWSEPIAGARGRKNRIWGVEGLGGGSRINAMLWTRGPPGDYAAWADMGLGDWGWDEVEPYFRRMENAIAHPDSKARGHKGPIEIRQPKSPFQWAPYLQKAVEKVGLPIAQDYNDPKAPANGYFALDLALNRRGERVSAMRAFLGKDVALQRRDRLTICAGTVASRLDLDGDKGLVTGVYIRSSKAADKNTDMDFFVKARREVIVCSGAICTPQLLMLSGIGPKDSGKHLNIPLVKELPAVGKKLYDHYSFPVMLEMPRNETLHVLQSIWALWYLLLWILFGTGVLGAGSTRSSIFVRTGAIDEKTMQVKAEDDDDNDTMDASEPRNIPDLEIMITPISSFQRPVPGHSLFTLYPTLTQPHGQGHIKLACLDPLAHPRVTLPMHRDERDVVSTRLAMRFTMRIAEEFQNSGYPHDTPLIFAPGNNLGFLSEYEKGDEEFDANPAAPEVHGADKSDAAEKTPVTAVNTVGKEDGKTWRNVTDEEIDDYTARVSHTSLHYAGTCAMSNDDRTGVVDQQLRVHGFRNLRIADASVFPKAPSAHPMAAIMMISERCAEFIKQDWAKRKTE